MRSRSPSDKLETSLGRRLVEPRSAASAIALIRISDAFLSQTIQLIVGVLEAIPGMPLDRGLVARIVISVAIAREHRARTIAVLLIDNPVQLVILVVLVYVECSSNLKINTTDTATMAK